MDFLNGLQSAKTNFGVSGKNILKTPSKSKHLHISIAFFKRRLKCSAAYDTQCSKNGEIV